MNDKGLKRYLLIGLDPVLMASFIAMALAGRKWAKAAEYRRQKAGLDSRERVLAAGLARIERESRSPRLFPRRVYELTFLMLDHAVVGELDRLAALIRSQNQKTCELVLDQCAAVADCILTGRSSAWPPSDDDLRMTRYSPRETAPPWRCGSPPRCWSPSCQADPGQGTLS